MMAKQIAVDLVPQGTLVERIRAGGCGLGGVLTPTGVGTIVEAGKRRVELNGKTFLLEAAMRADFALIHAFVADHLGNLTYVLTARNFNPVMAMAADTVIVTAEHIVPVGVVAPDQVITPAPLVDYLVMNGVIYGRTMADCSARRARASIGDLVNLGIGIPSLVANYVPAGRQIFFQSENGFIGTGWFPSRAWKSRC